MDSFQPSRGIRQGDPLSPYLFILRMEFLGHLIEGKCNEQLWTKATTSKSRPAFSHLFFADDLVLFARANPENCSTIKEVLHEFCTRSGQVVSEAKSWIYFSPNVDPDIRETLANTLGFQTTPNLGKYLGFPLKHSKNRSHDFGFGLDRVKQKLRDGKLIFSLWLEERSSSKLRPPPYQLTLCKMSSSRIKFLRALIE